MNSGELLHAMESHFEKAGVRSIYGEPITAEGRVIVPVAKIRYGFGAGSGSQAKPGDTPSEGGGGGGGLMVVPCGVVEVSAAGTRFVPIGRASALSAAAIAGALFGLWLGRRIGRRKQLTAAG